MWLLGQGSSGSSRAKPKKPQKGDEKIVKTRNDDLWRHDLLFLCLQYGSAENVNLLNFLASFEAPLTLKDSEGHTPLYYARQQGSGVMAKALVELLGEAEANQVIDSTPSLLSFEL